MVRPGLPAAAQERSSSLTPWCVSCVWSWQNGTDTPAQPGASVGGAAGSQENTQGTGDDALTGDTAPNDTQDSARMGRSTLRRGAESTATFRQMLENGYVHDSDGFLNDGENTSW